MRNALAHANKNGRRVVSAFIATAFAQGSADAAGIVERRAATGTGPLLSRRRVFNLTYLRERMFPVGR